jgi:hypothetical protein
MRPGDNEYATHFKTYVDLVPEADVMPALQEQLHVIDSLPSRVGASREEFAYAPGKWSIRQVLGHVNDAERVFAFRALTFSRFDPNPLPGFDENGYVDHGHFGATSLRLLADEFLCLRRANIEMLRRLDAAQWTAEGTANAKPITVRALAYVMAGHVRHHLGLLRDRYAVT